MAGAAGLLPACPLGTGSPKATNAFLSPDARRDCSVSSVVVLSELRKTTVLQMPHLIILQGLKCVWPFNDPQIIPMNHIFGHGFVADT